MNFDFTAAYNRNNWSDFFKKILLPLDFAPGSEQIELEYQPRCLEKSVNFLGSCQSLDLNVYEMHHKSLHDPRISISRDAFRFLEHHKIKNALILFISGNSDNYRLSLITRELKLSGKKVTTEFTNPKRYSYLLGPDIKRHTVEEYLFKKGRVKDEEDLRSRFSVEIVNKDFYNSIAEKFSELVGGVRGSGSRVREFTSLLHLPGTSDPTLMREFSVRLIGRLVFCWFLKKKKSAAGKPLISDEVLSSQAVENHPGYYHKILEPLFFEVMNRKVEERRDDIKHNPLFQDIPFLNGGLFDHNIHKDYYEPYGPESEHKYAYNLKIADDWFSAFFSILELYNFTIDENTPVDIDISVDPEMLGRIFENLLAEIVPETQETARKNTGSYYTPRPIVEYMVDESLTAYLLSRFSEQEKNEQKIRDLLDYRQECPDFPDEDSRVIADALDALKILDPACGSGAFPMGILQKMLLIRQKMICDGINEKVVDESWHYRYKLYAIRRSIYGVDKQTIAVEIAKLRLFLTLVVDETVNDSKPNRGIRPLPNLSFKFVAADSLIDLDLSKSDQFDWMINELFDEFIDKLEKLRDRYFYSETDIEKDKIKQEFNDIQSKLEKFLKEKQVDKTLKKLAYKLVYWLPFEDTETDWFSPRWMFGVKDGFDIIIGNPPYIQLQNDHGRLAKKYEKEGYTTFCRSGDIYSLFYERGINLLRPNGVLCYISSNKWMRAKYGEATRKFFSLYQPLVLIDLGSNIFESATVDTNILLIRKAKREKHSLKALDISKKKKKENFISHPNWVTLSNLSSDTWTISSPIAQRIKEKIEKIGKPLKDWDVSIYRGILTGYNEAFIIDPAKRDELLNKCKTSSERQRTEQLFKPILRGRDIKRYRADWAGLWLIASHNGYTDEEGNHIPPIYINNFPTIKRHLDQYYPQLEKRYDKGITPYNLRNCSYYQEFDRDKIIYPETTHGAFFYYDSESKYYCEKTCFFMTGADIKFIYVMLGSKLMKYYYTSHCSGTKLGVSGFQYNKHSLEKVYIVEIQKHLLELSNQIIEIKESNHNTDELEAQIDQMVYKLYKLTTEEISFIEN